jgi:Mn2+/Fe2+ NRAMP family transporter
VIFGGAAFVLVPGLNLISIMLVSQIVNGILLPFLLVFLIRIVNDRRVMGRYTNGRVYNTLSWATVVLVMGLTAALMLLTILGAA